MIKTRIAIALVLVANAVSGFAANNYTDKQAYVLCGHLIDPRYGTSRKNAEIVIEAGKILEIRDFDPNLTGMTPLEGHSGFIVLKNETCLPGLIDTHTHVLLNGDITAADYDFQLLKESPEYRTILATVNARRALEYGFTAIRDLETEGAGYADVDVKKAINNGVIPGPRMQVATRALDVTGAYPLLGYAPSVPVPHDVQVVDGPEEGRKAVREEIMYGADWIKVYSDHGYFLKKDASGRDILDDIPTFTVEEMRAIVDEAHRQHHKVD